MVPLRADPPFEEFFFEGHCNCLLVNLRALKQPALCHFRHRQLLDFLVNVHIEIALYRIRAVNQPLQHLEFVMRYDEPGVGRLHLLFIARRVASR